MATTIEIARAIAWLKHRGLMDSPAITPLEYQLITLALESGEVPSALALFVDGNQSALDWLTPEEERILSEVVVGIRIKYPELADFKGAPLAGLG